MRVGLFISLLALILPSCGAATTGTTGSTSPAAAASTSTTTAAPGSTSTTKPATTTTVQEVDVEIRDGEVIGSDRFHYERGETTNITIRSDTAYEVHVHGYDLRYDLEPGKPFTVEFTADVPGIFEVETHPGHLILFEIEVGG